MKCQKQSDRIFNSLKDKWLAIDIDYVVNLLERGYSVTYLMSETGLGRTGFYSLLKFYFKYHILDETKEQRELVAFEAQAKNNFFKYGVENVYASHKVKQIIKKTNNKKYGVDYPQQNKKINNKSVKTRLKTNIDTGAKNLDPILNDPDLLESVYEDLDFDKTKLCSLFNVGESFLNLKLNGYGIDHVKCRFTKPEMAIKDILPKTTIYQSKKLIGQELDFYIPEKNLAIEVNGIYWHCQINRHGNNIEPNHHRNKYEKCLEKNINLISFYDSEINNKFPIVKSMINSRLGLNKRLYARKCQVIPVEQKSEKKLFLEQNHLQGTCGSSVDLGLYHKNEMVALMTFGKSRFNKNIQWELIRFCNKLNTTVIGGASKLFKYFTNNYSGDIVSYSNNRYTTGNLYKQLGFDLINENKVAYYYTKDYCNLFHRSKFQKHKLKSLFPETYDKSLTEWDNMQIAGYNRIHDEGSKTWIYYILNKPLNNRK